MDMYQKSLKAGEKFQHFAYPWYRFKVRNLERKNVLVAESRTYNMDVVFEEMNCLDDNYRWHTSVWMVMSFSHVYTAVEEFILLCHQNGIIEHWTEMFYRDRSVKIEEEPQVLTMKMLSAGFYVWLVSVAITCIVFVGEHIYFFFTI